MTQQKFEVGEMAITQHATYFSEFDGSLCIITQPLQIKLCKDLNLMEKVHSHVYEVRLMLKGEPRFWLRPWQLRRLGYGDKFESGKATKASGRNRGTKLFVIDS